MTRRYPTVSDDEMDNDDETNSESDDSDGE